MTSKSEGLEEVAREIVRENRENPIFEPACIGDDEANTVDRRRMDKRLTETIASALKAEGDKREAIGFSRGQEKRASCVCDAAKDIACGLHYGMIINAQEKGYQKALKANPILEVEEIEGIIIDWLNHLTTEHLPYKKLAQAISAAMRGKDRI